MTLEESYNTLKLWGYETDKGSVHSYISVYEELLKPYQYTANNVLEIGLLNGVSIRMWEAYFSEKCRVYGIDSDIMPIGGMGNLKPMIDSGFKIKIGDAEDKATVEKFFSGIKFDVIIEDANHSVEQQLKLYENFKPYLSNNGIYIIEDIQDIDATKEKFINIDNEKNVQVIDLRNNKGRYDDVLVVIK